MEWLPVSSSGQTLVASIIRGLGVGEAYRLALFIHMATGAAAATVYWRRLRSAIISPRSWDMTVLVVPTLIGAPVALAIAEAFPSLDATIAMTITGLLLACTGVFLLFGGGGERGQLSISDLVLLGIVQGLAVLPGLSRSGVATAVLLIRRVEPVLTFDTVFYTAIPASLAAALYAAMRGPVVFDSVVLVCLAIAYLMGIATMKAMLALASRFRRKIAVFMILYGTAMLVTNIPTTLPQ